MLTVIPQEALAESKFSVMEMNKIRLASPALTGQILRIMSPKYDKTRYVYRVGNPASFSPLIPESRPYRPFTALSSYGSYNAVFNCWVWVKSYCVLSSNDYFGKSLGIYLNPLIKNTYLDQCWRQYRILTCVFISVIKTVIRCWWSRHYFRSRRLYISILLLTIKEKKK